MQKRLKNKSQSISTNNILNSNIIKPNFNNEILNSNNIEMYTY